MKFKFTRIKHGRRLAEQLDDYPDIKAAEQAARATYEPLSGFWVEVVLVREKKCHAS